MNDAIGVSAADTSIALDIKCIIAFTQSGLTARRLARFRPQAPIIGVCFDEVTERAMLPIFGVEPYFSDIQNTRENDVDLAKNIALMKGCHYGDFIIVVAGYPEGHGATNMMRIVEITEN